MKFLKTWVKEPFSYFMKDIHHFWIWILVIIVHGFNMWGAWSANQSNDGRNMTFLTCISCFITVYWWSLQKADNLIFKYFKGEFKELEINVISTLIIWVLWYSLIGSLIGFAFGFVPYFDMGFSGKESDAIFCQNSKAYILGIEWDYCKNGLWKNTKGYLEELSKKDASLSDWWMHFVLAGTRSVAESFLTSFLFISYECIKASKIVANARIKAEQDKKTAEDLRIVAEKGKKTAEDLRIVAEKEKEKAELFRDALNHEEWFHFSSNIFSHAVEVVSNITQNSDKEEEQQLKTYLNGLAQLFRYKNAHS